jgi:hypothetical protein
MKGRDWRGEVLAPGRVAATGGADKGHKVSRIDGQKEIANEVLVGLADKLGKINGGDDGALAEIKDTLFAALDEIDEATEDEEQGFARMEVAEARAALADEILTSIGRLSALYGRLNKVAHIPDADADTLYGMASAMKPIEHRCHMDRDELGFLIGQHGDGGTFLARAVDDVEQAIEDTEDEANAHLFYEWAKDADATSEMPDYLKGYLKDCMIIVAAEVCVKLGVPRDSTIAAVAQSRAAVQS